MAYISDKYEFVFFSADATGSTAIIKSLADNDIGRLVPPENIVKNGVRIAPAKHTTVQQLRNINMLEGKEHYKKVAGIRNPFSWHVAKYLRNTTSRYKAIGNPNSWINKLPKAERERYVGEIKRQASETFKEYLQRHFKGKDPYELQAGFHEDVDIFIHQETLDIDFEAFKISVGLPSNIKVPKFNLTNAMPSQKTYADYFDDELVELIYHYHQPFFQKFPEYLGSEVKPGIKPV